MKNKINKQEIRYPFDFLNKDLRNRSLWNKHKGSYTKDFIVWVDEEYTRLQQKKSDILYLTEHLQSQLVDTEWEIERLEEGYWWFV
jgi:hypothetical protein